MGKNLPAAEHTYNDPIQRKLRFILDHSANADYGYNDSHFIDIAQSLSLVNRKAYRQGLYYYINKITVHDSNQDAWLKFCTANNDWLTRNAWIRGFRAWSKMNSDAVQMGDDLDVAGAYHDFKIWLSENHYNNADGGSGNTIFPIGSTDYTEMTFNNGIYGGFNITQAQPFPAGEWVYSVLRSSETGGSVNLCLLGDPNDASMYSLQKGYMDTRNRPRLTSPSQGEEVSTDFIQLMHTKTTGAQEDILEDLEDDNDAAPYSITLYQHETVVQSQTANSAGAGAVTHAEGFICPFGLLEIVTNSKVDGKIEVVIELAAGEYHGVAAARVC